MEYHRPAAGHGALVRLDVADHAAVAPEVHDPNIGNTGLDNRKVGMWIFLGSDCMFFGSLIGTYLSYKGKSLYGPGPHDVFNIPLTSYSAALLLRRRRLFMVLALAAAAGDDRQGRRLLAPSRPRSSACTSCSTRSTSSGASPCTRASRCRRTSSAPRSSCSPASTAPTSRCGVLWLIDHHRAGAARASSTAATTTKVEVAGLYWHFVDIVWIAIFTVIYLIP